MYMYICGATEDLFPTCRVELFTAESRTQQKTVSHVEHGTLMDRAFMWEALEDNSWSV